MTRVDARLSFEFAPEATGAVVVHMEREAASHSGWINARPVILPQDEPPAPGMFAIFGGSPHKVPRLTWLPGAEGRDGATGRATVGLQHAGGPHAVRHLRDLGHPVPEGWRVTQDHPRRGLVAEVPAEADHAAVLGWLIEAGLALCEVPVTGLWRADIYD